MTRPTPRPLETTIHEAAVHAAVTRRQNVLVVAPSIRTAQRMFEKTAEVLINMHIPLGADGPRGERQLAPGIPESGTIIFRAEARGWSADTVIVYDECDLEDVYPVIATSRTPEILVYSYVHDPGEQPTPEIAAPAEITIPQALMEIARQWEIANRIAVQQLVLETEISLDEADGLHHIVGLRPYPRTR